MESKYELSINPRSTPYGGYSLSLASLLEESALLIKKMYANSAELGDALDRLKIDADEKTQILDCVKRGDIYRILGFRVSDEVAMSFGGADLRNEGDLRIPLTSARES